MAQSTKATKEEFVEGFKQHVEASQRDSQRWLMRLSVIRHDEDRRQFYDPPAAPLSWRNQIVRRIRAAIRAITGAGPPEESPVQSFSYWQMPEPIVIRGVYYVLGEDGTVTARESTQEEQEQQNE